VFKPPAGPSDGVLETFYVKVIERGGRKPSQDLSYTIFVLAVLWLVVGVPFITGAVLAFAINR
jgi:hypothetical protein